MPGYLIPVIILVIIFVAFFSMRSSSVSGQLDKMYRHLENKGYNTKALNSLNSINIESIQYFCGISDFKTVVAVRLFIYDHKSLILFPSMKHEAPGLEEMGQKRFMEIPLAQIREIEILCADYAVKNNRLPSNLANEIMVGDNAAFLMFLHYKNPDQASSQSHLLTEKDPSINSDPNPVDNSALILRIGLTETSVNLIKDEILQDIHP